MGNFCLAQANAQVLDEYPMLAAQPRGHQTVQYPQWTQMHLVEQRRQRRQRCHQEEEDDDSTLCPDVAAVLRVGRRSRCSGGPPETAGAPPVVVVASSSDMTLAPASGTGMAATETVCPARRRQLHDDRCARACPGWEDDVPCSGDEEHCFRQLSENRSAIPTGHESADSIDQRYRFELWEETLGEAVLVHLYEISDTFAQLNAVALDMLGLGAVLHVGVEVFGQEFSFGMQGLSVSLPKRHRYYAYRQSVHMGRTRLSKTEVEAILGAMKDEWLGPDYNLFTKNCGSFCNALCLRLGVGGLPPWVTWLGEAFGKMPAAEKLACALSSSSSMGGGGTPSPSPVRTRRGSWGGTASGDWRLEDHGHWEAVNSRVQQPVFLGVPPFEVAGANASSSPPRRLCRSTTWLRHECSMRPPMAASQFAAALEQAADKVSQPQTSVNVRHTCGADAGLAAPQTTPRPVGYDHVHAFRQGCVAEVMLPEVPWHTRSFAFRGAVGGA